MPPRADGTLDDKTLEILEGIGEWMEVNGDAIYNTRPWLIYGEGPKREMGHSDNTSPYNEKNIRYTQSKDGKTLNVIFLGWPGEDVTLHQVLVENENSDAEINLLGHNKAIKYSTNSNGEITIIIPELDAEKLSFKHAYCFQLNGFKLTASEPW